LRHNGHAVNMSIMRKLEKVLKALANRRRLAILRYLKENKSAPVGEIAHETKSSYKAASKHLRILFVTDIVDREQKRFQVFYYLSSSQRPEVRQVLSLL